jgi:hypothetical protein
MLASDHEERPRSKEDRRYLSKAEPGLSKAAREERLQALERIANSVNVHSSKFSAAEAPR